MQEFAPARPQMRVDVAVVLGPGLAEHVVSIIMLANQMLSSNTRR